MTQERDDDGLYQIRAAEVIGSGENDMDLGVTDLEGPRREEAGREARRENVA